MVEEHMLKIKDEIPTVEVIEGMDFGPIDLVSYIKNLTEELIQFTAKLEDDRSLPQGVIFDEKGILSGLPEKGTAKDTPYMIAVTAKGESTSPLTFTVPLLIFSPPEAEKRVREILEGDVKTILGLDKYWDKFSKELPLPDLKSILTSGATPEEVDYLLQQFATLTIWNTDDLTPPNEKEGQLIDLSGVSSRYRVYDFGAALVATPVDLYDSQRTFEDVVRTAQAMVQEVKQRGWNIEMAGFDKMMRAAWLEAERINRSQEKPVIQVRGYQPTEEDYESLNRQMSIGSPSA